MPTINLTRSHYFTQQRRRGWIGLHPRKAWPMANSRDNVGGFSLPRIISPPPRSPKLDVILLVDIFIDIGALGRRLAKDLGHGYVHLDLRAVLAEVNTLPFGKGKSQALGLLHPIALRRYMKGESKTLAARHIIDAVLRRIKQLVSKGTKKYVVTGFREWHEVHYFNQTIARPDAVVWLQHGEKWGPEKWLHGAFGEKKVVKVKPGRAEDVYREMMRGFGERAAVAKNEGGDGKVKTEGAGGEVKVKNEDVGEKVKSEDEEMSKRNKMIAMVANAALCGDPVKKAAPKAADDAVRAKRADTPMQKDDADLALDLLDELQGYIKDRKG